MSGGGVRPTRGEMSSGYVKGDKEEKVTGEHSQFGVNKEKEFEDALKQLAGNLKELVSSLKNLPDEKKKELEGKVRELKQKMEELKEHNVPSAEIQQTLNSAQQLMQEAAALQGAKGVGGTEQGAQVSKVLQIVKHLCSELLLGKDMAMATLKEGPKSLLGSTLVVQQTGDGVTISFQGITAANAKEAALLMQNSPELMQKLQNDLAQKNVAATSINLGGHVVVELPQPTVTITTATSEQSFEREGGGQGRERGGEGGKEGKEQREKR